MENRSESHLDYGNLGTHSDTHLVTLALNMSHYNVPLYIAVCRFMRCHIGSKHSTHQLILTERYTKVIYVKEKQYIRRDLSTLSRF